MIRVSNSLDPELVPKYFEADLAPNCFQSQRLSLKDTSRQE